MLWLYRWIRGVLAVECSADIPERFLNLCAKNGVTVWKIKRVKGKIRCRIGIRDFKRLPSLIRHSGVRLHILQKDGLPFLLARLKGRYGIPAGAILFFVFLQGMSAFIWSVEVVGNRGIGTQTLLRACEEIGVKEGTYAGGIDYKTASQRLLLRVPGLSWCSMNLEGCRLTVNVSEIAESEDPEKAPCNLKAKADGTITKIDLKSGNCLVKVGDTVAKGDLLVSGISEQTGEFVRSAGTVRAKTYREITVAVPCRKTETVPTGKPKTKRVLSVFGIKAPLYLGRTKGNYREKTSVKQARLFGVKLPLALYEKTFTFIKVRERELTEDEQRNEAEEHLRQIIAEENMENVSIENREYTQNNGELMLRATVLAEEEIAVEEKIIFNGGNP